MKYVRQERARNQSRNRCQKSSQLDDAVSPGEFSFGQQLWEQTVFRWPKKCRLSAGKKNRRHLDVQVLPDQSSGGDDHDENFEQLRSDTDGSFTEPIGEKASGHREQNEWNREQRACNQNQPVAGGLLEACAQNDEDNKILVGVIVEGALKLGDNQRPKAALPRGRNRFAGLFRGWHIGRI